MAGCNSSSSPNGCQGDRQRRPSPAAVVEETDPSGRYVRFADVLGRGADKCVYLAFDRVEGREVAWNQVPVTSDVAERLHSEVALLSKLNHRNIIKMFASWADTQHRHINFITELFTSGTLRQYSQKYPSVELPAVKQWARQILRGLLYLHSHDPPIIHRDLKCDNIFVNGNRGELKIGDLGLAKILEHKGREAHSVLGTPEFMAPELYDEHYTELVDVYSFGMCLLEVVTGQYPYSECSNAAQVFKRVSNGRRPQSLELVKDPDVRRVIELCISPERSRPAVRELMTLPFLADAPPHSLSALPSFPSPSGSHLTESAAAAALHSQVSLGQEYMSPGSHSSTFLAPRTPPLLLPLAASQPQWGPGGIPKGPGLLRGARGGALQEPLLSVPEHVAHTHAFRAAEDELRSSGESEYASGGESAGSAKSLSHHSAHQARATEPPAHGAFALQQQGGYAGGTPGTSFSSVGSPGGPWGGSGSRDSWDGGNAMGNSSGRRMSDSSFTDEDRPHAPPRHCLHAPGHVPSDSNGSCQQCNGDCHASESSGYHSQEQHSMDPHAHPHSLSHGQGHEQGFPVGPSATADRGFKIKGKVTGEGEVKLRLRIEDEDGNVQTVRFLFDLNEDTPLAVATEMIDELSLTARDVTTIAEKMEVEIKRLVPGWQMPEHLVGDEDESAIIVEEAEGEEQEEQGAGREGSQRGGKQGGSMRGGKGGSVRGGRLVSITPGEAVSGPIEGQLSGPLSATPSPSASTNVEVPSHEADPSSRAFPGGGSILRTSSSFGTSSFSASFGSAGQGAEDLLHMLPHTDTPQLHSDTPRTYSDTPGLEASSGIPSPLDSMELTPSHVAPPLPLESSTSAPAVAAALRLAGESQNGGEGATAEGNRSISLGGPVGTKGGAKGGNRLDVLSKLDSTDSEPDPSPVKDLPTLSRTTPAASESTTRATRDAASAPAAGPALDGTPRGTPVAGSATSPGAGSMPEEGEGAKGAKEKAGAGQAGGAGVPRAPSRSLSRRGLTSTSRRIISRTSSRVYSTSMRAHNQDLETNRSHSEGLPPGGTPAVHQSHAQSHGYAHDLDITVFHPANEKHRAHTHSFVHTKSLTKSSTFSHSPRGAPSVVAGAGTATAGVGSTYSLVAAATAPAIRSTAAAAAAAVAAVGDLGRTGVDPSSVRDVGSVGESLNSFEMQLNSGYRADGEESSEGGGSLRETEACIVPTSSEGSHSAGASIAAGTGPRAGGESAAPALGAASGAALEGLQVKAERGGGALEGEKAGGSEELKKGSSVPGVEGLAGLRRDQEEGKDRGAGGKQKGQEDGVASMSLWPRNGSVGSRSESVPGLASAGAPAASAAGTGTGAEAGDGTPDVLEKGHRSSSQGAVGTSLRSPTVSSLSFSKRPMSKSETKKVKSGPLVGKAHGGARGVPPLAPLGVPQPGLPRAGSGSSSRSLQTTPKGTVMRRSLSGRELGGGAAGGAPYVELKLTWVEADEEHSVTVGAPGVDIKRLLQLNPEVDRHEGGGGRGSGAASGAQTPTGTGTGFGTPRGQNGVAVPGSVEDSNSATDGLDGKPLGLEMGLGAGGVNDKSHGGSVVDKEEGDSDDDSCEEDEMAVVEERMNELLHQFAVAPMSGM